MAAAERGARRLFRGNLTNTVIAEAAMRAPWGPVHITGVASLAHNLLSLDSVGNLHWGQGILLGSLRLPGDDPRVHQRRGKKGPKDLEEQYPSNYRNGRRPRFPPIRRPRGSEEKKQTRGRQPEVEDLQSVFPPLLLVELKGGLLLKDKEEHGGDNLEKEGEQHPLALLSLDESPVAEPSGLALVAHFGLFRGGEEEEERRRLSS